MAFNERDDIRERYGKPQRPAVQFTRRDDVRDLMKSPQGKNYGNMMDLQNQAIRQGGFDKGDSRIDELKKARRQYNRKDKYGIAGLMGYSPQDANEIYRQNSGVLREHARPTYKTMYPISDMAHEVTGSGGLTGMLLNQAFGKSKKKGKSFLNDLRQMGADIFGGIGIGGAVPREEATEEILTNYSDKTFGPHREDIEEIEEVTKEYEGPWPHDKRSLMSDEQAAWLREMNQNPYYQNLLDPNVVLPFEKERRGHPHMETYTPDAGPILGTASPHDPTEGIRVAPWLTDPSLPMPVEEEAPPIIPFDDSNREEAIRRNMMTDQKSDKDHPLWDEYWNFLIDEGDSYDFVQGGPPSFEEYKDSRGRIYKGKPHALHSSYR